MSFLVRGGGGRPWSQSGTGAGLVSGLKSFASLRRRGDAPSAIDEALSPAGYLAAEVREARAAVAALDRYALQLRGSFDDAALELVEQAHLAMSRLQQAVAAQSGAPELILVACELRVAAQRGGHLLRAYGQSNVFGRCVAWTRRARVEAKFRAVTGRLRGLIPRAAPAAAAGGAVAATAAAAAAAEAADAVTGGGGGGGSSSFQATAGPGSTVGHASVGASSSSGAGAGPTAGATSGQLLRKGRHERVHSVAFAPPAVALASGAGTCVWWAREGCVEFYSDAAQATTSFATEDGTSLTCVAIDAAGNTWGGTNRGNLLARRPCVWDAQTEERMFTGPVRAMAFDAAAGTVWAGDEHGCLRSARLRDDPWQVEPLAVALPGRSPRRGLSTGTMLLSSMGRNTLLRRTTSTKADRSAAPPPLEGPVRAILARDSRVWAAGGRSEPWIALFDSVTGQHLDTWSCGSTGACNAMFALVWAPSGAAAPHAGNGSSSGMASMGSRALSLGIGGTADGRGGSGVGITSSGSLAPSSSLPAAVPEHEALPERSVSVGDGRSGWQLLTGHENGQVLVWNAARDRLQPACKLGDPGGSAVRAITTLDAWDLVVTAHASGDIALFARAANASDWGGGQPLAKVSTPADTPGGGGGGGGSSSGSISSTAMALKPAAATSVGVACVRPRRVTVRSHRSAIVAAAGCSSSGVATASGMGTVRLWRAADLAREAERAGLPLRATTASRRTTAASSASADSRVPAGFSRQTTASVEGGALLAASVGAIRTGSQPLQQPVDARPPPQQQQQQVEQRQVEQQLRQPPPPVNAVRASDAPELAASPFAGAFAAGGPFAVAATVQAPSDAASAPTHAEPVKEAPLPDLQAAGAALAAPPLLAAAVAAAAATRDAPPARTGSGPALAPRKPRAQRQVDALQEEESRERRRSERRLSKGAQIAWSACQIIDSAELKLLSPIGSGAYGRVWLAEWMGTQVAAKELLCLADRAKDGALRKREERRAGGDGAVGGGGPSSCEDGGGGGGGSDAGSEDSVDAEVAAEQRALMDEVFLLGTLSHPNIMRFCAVCLDPPMIVTQYYQRGSLFELLKKARRGDRRAGAELAWSRRLDMLRDVAAGMVFLHSRRPPVVHGDLRSPNLLLDMAFDHDKPRLHVKIADFGLACMMGPAKTLAVSKVTNPRWSAPEVIRDSRVSTSADVFSFAVVMWELLTWRQPYEDMLSIQVLFGVTQSLRPDMPDDDAELPGNPGAATLQSYKALMEACWHDDADQRPSFEQIVSRLDEMRTADRAARVAARTAAGDEAAGSRRTSYSGDSAPPSPLTSQANSPFNSGRSWRGTTTATTTASTAAAAATAGSEALTGGSGGSGGVSARASSADGGKQQQQQQQQQQQRSSTVDGAGSVEPPPAGLAAVVATGDARSDGLGTPNSGNSPGPFGASEPSFAFFAAGGSGAGGGGGGGGGVGGVVSSSGGGVGGPTAGTLLGGSKISAAGDGSGSSPTRTPSRLGRGSSSSASGMAAAAGANGASGGAAGAAGAGAAAGVSGGFGTAMHTSSPRATSAAAATVAVPRPSSPFAAVAAQQPVSPFAAASLPTTAAAGDDHGDGSGGGSGGGGGGGGSSGAGGAAAGGVGGGASAASAAAAAAMAAGDTNVAASPFASLAFPASSVTADSEASLPRSPLAEPSFSPFARAPQPPPPPAS